MPTFQQLRGQVLGKLIEVATSDNRIVAFWVEGGTQSGEDASVALDAHFAVPDQEFDYFQAGLGDFVGRHFPGADVGGSERAEAVVPGDTPVRLHLTLEPVGKLTGVERPALRLYVDKDELARRIEGD